MARAVISSVKKWDVVYSSELITICVGDEGMFYKVFGPGVRVKYFYGECAWSDATRFARDIDWLARIE